MTETVCQNSTQPNRSHHDRQEIIQLLAQGQPGAYRFEVKAANGYGVWNDTPTPLAFVIAPHFWQTALFQWTVGLLVVAVILLLPRRHVHNRVRTRSGNAYYP